MSEYLVAARSRGALPDFQAGDVIIGGPDGSGWGSRERKSAWIAAGRRAADWPAHTVIVRVPLHNWAKTLEYAGGSTIHTDNTDPEFPVILAFGRFNFALSELSGAEAAALDANGEIELTDDRADALLTDRRFGLRMSIIFAQPQG